jgi:hypothetical protein
LTQPFIEKPNVCWILHQQATALIDDGRGWIGALQARDGNERQGPVRRHG